METNPGPNYKFPCRTCEKPVKNNQNGLLCSICQKWHHTKCQDISIHEYTRLYQNPNEKWTCLTCSLPSFCDSLFTTSIANVARTRRISESELSTPTNVDNTTLYECFNDKFEAKGLHFVHLNVRSILYKISELRLLFSKNKISIIAISETWLKLVCK